MKVLLTLLEEFSNAGTQSLLMSIVRNFNDNVSFDLLLFNNCRGNLEDEFLSFGGKILRLPSNYGKSNFLKRLDFYVRWLKNYRKVKKILIDNGPYDAIHCNNSFESGYILKAASKVGVPVRIVHTHTQTDKNVHLLRKVYNSLFLKLVNKYATHKIGCSKSACESMYGKNANYSVINNPYNTQKFDKTKYTDSERKELSIVQIGSYSDNKNQKFTLDVFNSIKKAYPSAKLNFVGFDAGENYLSTLKEKVKMLNLQDNVSFYESDYDTAKLLSEAAYFVFPSHKEGFGIVLIEAQAMGVRCFVSDTVPKETDCGGCTYLPLSLGAEKWAEIIVEDYKKTGGTHGNFDCSRFSDKEVAKQYKKIYEGEFQ